MSTRASDAVMPTISEASYREFRAFFCRHTGTDLGEGKRFFTDRRLAERMRARGVAELGEYLALLRGEVYGAEMQALVNLMMINDTYFLREAHQFRALEECVLPEILGTRPADRPLRIWVAPCASGEEAYSIAMYLTDFLSGPLGRELEIVGSDIDTQALEAARSGVYHSRSLHRLDDDLLQRYFEPLGRGRYRVVPAVREAVRFTRVNLCDSAQTREYRGFDVIFCRNMLIYFDRASRQRVAQVLYDATAPGGFVFLGHAEFLDRISTRFHRRRLPQTVVYQRPVSPEV